MTRLVPLIVLLLLLPVVSVLGGDLPQVLQPNTTAYSASEVATLTQAIATLEKALNDYNLASRHYFPDEWTSRNFAMYTAGVLSEKGYETVLVSGAGWPEGVHTWVLVGVPLGARTSWIPIEATPEQGDSQQILGHIPSTTNAAGKLCFEESYLNFSDVLQLPSNLAPIAKIRAPAPPVTTDKTLTFMAISSYDPDGEIVLYLWDFGDGETKAATSWRVRHEFRRDGNVVVTLTVLDNLGKKASAEMRLFVMELEEPPSTPSSGGCGCGG